MNWSRYKLLWVTGGVTLVLTGVAVFFWMRAGAQNEELESDIQRLQTDRRTLTGQTPFPSSDSVEALKTEQEKVQALRDELLQTIEEGQLTPPRLARTMFADYARDLVPRLRRLAKTSTKGGEDGVILQDPEFGLGDYLRGELPEASRIPSLMLELETMSRLAELLFTSGISELVDIEVTEVEEESEGRRAGRLPGALPGRNRSTDRRGAASGEEEEPDPAVQKREQVRKEMERMFTPLVFELRFKVYEDMFWDVMNRLVNDENQFVVRRIHVTNGNANLWPQGVQPAFGSENRQDPSRRDRQPRNELEDMLAMMDGGGGTDPAEEETTEVAIAGITERRQRTTGGELLHVSMRIALYRLTPDVLAREEN